LKNANRVNIITKLRQNDALKFARKVSMELDSTIVECDQRLRIVRFKRLKNGEYFGIGNCFR